MKGLVITAQEAMEKWEGKQFVFHNPAQPYDEAKKTNPLIKVWDGVKRDTKSSNRLIIYKKQKRKMKVLGKDWRDSYRTIKKRIYPDIKLEIV